MPPSKKRAATTKNKTLDMTSTPINSITVASEVADSGRSSVIESEHSSPRASTAPLEEAGDELTEKAAEEVTSEPASPVVTITHSNNLNMGATKVNGHVTRGAPAYNAVNHVSYENANLDEITFRQLNEDIAAYNNDFEWCEDMLTTGEDLTPQEVRTYQLRQLDLGHQIRHCKNRIETMQIQYRYNFSAAALPPIGSFNTARTNITNRSGAAVTKSNAVRLVTDTLTPGGAKLLPRSPLPIRSSTAAKGKRSREASPDDGPEGGCATSSSKRHKGAVMVEVDPVEFPDDTNVEDIPGPILAKQRKGFWKCSLCSAPRYLLAGAGRSPAQPCKWPLRDISKMITHFCVMHREHPSRDRCLELGQALTLNRGPFEYWVKSTRSVKVENDAVITNCLDELSNGKMPEFLRKLSNSASKLQEN
ncbi:hypothetical protein B0H66DRAFT_538327 [Apodospora peruviana]|uniref:Uncharacterized protein n=1 Tax=Apodospora peruviana TaxID=516989 RepID=A0AAE0HVA9_9PEZI|nr:hypothetical protein B0H66DRAFT_538327 [Apodospora peruviana]